MHAMNGVRVAWITVMTVMKSNFMDGTELSKGSFRGLSIRCSTVGL